MNTLRRPNRLQAQARAIRQAAPKAFMRGNVARGRRLAHRAMQILARQEQAA